MSDLYVSNWMTASILLKRWLISGMDPTMPSSRSVPVTGTYTCFAAAHRRRKVSGLWNHSGTSQGGRRRIRRDGLIRGTEDETLERLSHYTTEPAGLAAEWEAIVRQVRARHCRKSGCMAGFEALAAGRHRTRQASFLERAKVRWGARYGREHP
jgi:hypothetical protein